MTSQSQPSRRFISLGMGMLACALAGCGTAGFTTLALGGDVRGRALISDAAPRPIVSGPARLLHVDSTGIGAVTLFSVTAPAGGSADCADAAQARTAIPSDDTSHLNLDVQPDQTICVAGSIGRRAVRAEVAWHAQKPTLIPGETNGAKVILAHNH